MESKRASIKSMMNNMLRMKEIAMHKVLKTPENKMNIEMKL